MKAYLLPFLFLFFITGKSQQVDTIEVNQFRTTQIIFDDAIELVEPGTGDIQIKNKIVDNILIIQSIVPLEDFIPTNLFIKTKSNFYNPSIKFSKNILKSTYLEKEFKSAVGKQSNQYSNTQNKINTIKEEKTNNDDFDVFGNPKYKSEDKNLINLINSKKDVFKPSRDYTTGVFFRFCAHYLSAGKVYYKFELENESSLKYDIKDIYFTVRNKKNRNSSKSEKDIEITKNLTNIKMINGLTTRNLIYEFEPFSIGKDEEMIINIKEQDGSRDLTIGIPYYIINQPIKL